LHDEIRRTMDLPEPVAGSPTDETFTAGEGGKA